jgi:hypothetical protein
MKAFAVLLSILALFVAMPATAQIDQYSYVKNGLATLGMTEGNVVRIESLVYGPYVLSASGKGYLPAGVLDAWYGDIDATTPNQVLFFQPTYDSVPFPDARMNSSENYNLAEDRAMPGFQYAIASGKGRLSLLLPPIKGQRGVLMYRVTVKEATPQPEYATHKELNETNIVVVDLADRVQKLEATQYRPPEPLPAPFDGAHFIVGYGTTVKFRSELSDGNTEVPLIGNGCALSLSLSGRVLLGAILNGAYEGQGGITPFAEYAIYTFDPQVPGASFLIGGSLSIFRKLDKAASPRSYRYGQLYVAVRAYLDPFGAKNPAAITLGFGSSFEVLTTKDGGFRATDHDLAVMLRIELLAF